FYEALHTLDPDDEAAVEVLAEKYEGMRKWPNLIELLEQQAGRAEGAARTAVLVRIAQLYADKLRNQAEATTAFETVLAEDPENAEALEALDGMYEKRRDWDNLVEIRRKRADMSEDAAGRLAAYKELADYATKKIRRPNICLALWEQVREIAPGDKDALSALVDFYEQDKNWEALTEAIDELVDQEPDDNARAELLQKAGIVLQ
ncbi:MAG: hypothetical protein KC620_26865, partial [Myxococcales bacterium]|nr:hypothetical protein [Myxococcales bacterium]